MDQDITKDLIDKNLSLFELLKRADEEELSVLADIITDKGDGRLMLDKNVKETIISRKSAKKLSEIYDTLAREICAFGSHSLKNVGKSAQGTEYSRILKDVAKHFRVTFEEGEDHFSIENKILKALLLKALSEENKSAVKEYVVNCESLESTEKLAEDILNSFDLDQIRELVKSALSDKFILSLCSGVANVKNVGSSALSAAGIMTTAKVASSLVARINPLTATVAGVASVLSLSGPAFRIVIPAVVQIALIRYQQVALEVEKFCEELESCA